jgi:formamidopyrimidine-DNA glycosylase
MPELPEVEVVRAGLQRWVTGRRIARVDVHRDRSVRRHRGGPVDFRDRLVGADVIAAHRRGKFLWLELAGDREVLVAHLGMSGQLLLPPAGSVGGAHTRVSIEFADGDRPLLFVDQRTFGWLSVEPLVASTAGSTGRLVPLSVTGIAPDPFEQEYVAAEVARRLRRRSGAVKSALLDQNLVAGVGNIYADEALWRARRHWATPCDRLRQADAVGLLEHARQVMAEALQQGGTSFDSLYVNVNGQSGYFSRSLAAYGRAGSPCHRCGSSIVREPYANRSSFRCPRCQRRPAGLASPVPLRTGLTTS